MSDILLDAFVLVGGQYHELKKVIKDIQINDFLSFVADDEYAVKVFWNEYLIGYPSRTKNTIIFNMLVNDLKLYGLVTRINKHFFSQLEFDIYLQL